MNKKIFQLNNGQAALEFMMTYGWAMLLLLTVIGGLVYFSPNVDTLVGKKCVFGAGLSCLGTQFNSTELTLVLQNGFQETIYNVTANITGPVIGSCTVSNRTLSVDQKLTIRCQNSGVLDLTSDSKIKMLIMYKKNRDGFDQSLLGDVYAKYQD